MSYSEAKEELQIRNYQVYTAKAKEIDIETLLKNSSENNLSKADIILIMTIFKGGLIEFIDTYKKYVEEAEAKGWVYCDKAHYFLKRIVC